MGSDGRRALSTSRSISQPDMDKWQTNLFFKLAD